MHVLDRRHVRDVCVLYCYLSVSEDGFSSNCIIKKIGQPAENNGLTICGGEIHEKNICNIL